jgi:Zn-finger protein
MVSWKYTQMSASRVCEDLWMNHGRKISTKLVQSLSAHVEGVAIDKEFEWQYALPEFDQLVSHVSIGRDGTTTAIRGEGYRETMCGTISFYNASGDRLHTIYSACAPEYGKKTFDSVLNMEIAHVKKRFPKVMYVGLADGAKDNWTYLAAHAQVEILDFYHATEYLTKAGALLKKGEQAQKEWTDNACHDLKHKKNGARFILRELKSWIKEKGTDGQEAILKTISYFENNLARMNYPEYQKMGYPIGSGVTEAGCKTVVKQRLCQSGMRWRLDNAQGMLITRALVHTDQRWEQFWKFYMR